MPFDQFPIKIFVLSKFIYIFGFVITNKNNIPAFPYIKICVLARVNFIGS